MTNAIALLPTSQNVPPLRYVMHITPTRCRTCGKLHQISAFYELHEMMARSGMTPNRVRNLRPVDDLAWACNVEVIVLAERHLPICTECVTTDTMARRMKDLPSAADRREWLATEERKRLAFEASERALAAAKLDEHETTSKRAEKRAAVEATRKQLLDEI